MCNIALELVLKVCPWQTPSAWHGSSLESLSPTQMSWVRSSEAGLRDPHTPTFDNHRPERPVVRGGTCCRPAPWFHSWFAPSQKKAGGRAEAEAGGRLLPGPACSPGWAGPSQTWVTQAAEETKAPPEAWNFPLECDCFGRQARFLCFQWCCVIITVRAAEQRALAESKAPGRQTTPGGPEGQRARGCCLGGGRRGSGNGSLPVTAFSDFLAACGPEQRHSWLTLVCCEGVSSSKTQDHPGLA